MSGVVRVGQKKRSYGRHEPHLGHRPDVPCVICYQPCRPVDKRWECPVHGKRGRP